MSPDFAISIYNERNAFWDVNLQETPQDVVNAARQLAIQLADDAKNGLSVKQVSEPLRNVLEALLVELDNDLARAQRLPVESEDTSILSKRLRSYTRVHVKARQILNDLYPPQILEY